MNQVITILNPVGASEHQGPGFDRGASLLFLCGVTAPPSGTLSHHINNIASQIHWLVQSSSEYYVIQEKKQSLHNIGLYSHYSWTMHDHGTSVKNAAQNQVIFAFY